MEALKSRKKGRKLEVSRSRPKSKKYKRERSYCVSSSESSDSSMSNHRTSVRIRSRGRDSKRKRGRSRSTDSSDQHSRKRNRQPSTNRAGTEKKKKISKNRHKERQPSTNRAGTEKKKKISKNRHKEHPLRRSARGSKQRYRRSISISCSCSDSSCNYSSESCSTCSSYQSNSDGNSSERRQSTRSKKSSNHRGHSKAIKERDGLKGQEKKGKPYKKGADELGIRNPNGKKVYVCNGKVSSRSKVVHSPERVKTRKRIRNHLEESYSLSIPVENKKMTSRNYSNMDASQPGKPISCIAECSMEERADEPKAEFLELLLRQKALENLKKFRGCQFGMAEVLSSNKFEQPVCLGSTETVQVVSDARLQGSRTCENEEFEQKLKKPTIADRVLNQRHIDSRRDYQHHIEASSSQREDDTFVLGMDLIRIQPSGHRGTCTSPVPSSKIPPISEFHADCYVNSVYLDSEVDPFNPEISKTSSVHNDESNQVKIANKDSEVACLNKQCTSKTEMTELKESSVQVLQDCTLKDESVPDNSESDALQVCTSKHKISQTSQTKMVKADLATEESLKDDMSQTEMHKSDDFTTSSKNQNSRTEVIKDIEGTGENSKEDASQTAIKESVDSTFQQKTMSVMRGGEMVQVSYKVYIPQRAATLAKRQRRR